MPEENINTIEPTVSELMIESISEKKKEIKSLKKSLKQEQNRSTELREKNTNLESENRLLRYKVKNNRTIKFFEILFNAMLGFGLGILFLEHIDPVYKWSVIGLGVVGTFFMQFVNGKE